MSEALASPLTVSRYEEPSTHFTNIEATEQVFDDEDPRGVSQPKEPHNVGHIHEHGPDEKRGTKRKRDSLQSLEDSGPHGPRPRSLSRVSGSRQSKSRSVSRQGLSPHLEYPLRTPSPHSPTSLNARDHDIPATLLSPEVLDSKEDMHLDETSSDTVSHLLHVSPHPPSSRTSPVAEAARRQDYVIAAPPPAPVVSFSFDSDVDDMVVETTASPEKFKVPDDFIQFTQEYSLPPLSILPAEFRRNGSGRHKKKRDKERHERGSDRDSRRDDWTPLGINKWAAILRANPVWKKLSKASKCVSTHDWNVSDLSHVITAMY